MRKQLGDILENRRRVKGSTQIAKCLNFAKCQKAYISNLISILARG
jgi:hypothetical protein